MSGEDREVIFEITRIGDAQRVAAIDVASGVEVVVQAPASAALADVRALALRRLVRALSENGAAGDGRRGKLV
ncbi:MAG: serine hydroxymethyltransferase [Hyphomonadaceae bacterium]